jgi:imidazolonepropionase-like amidohydrolase
MKLSFCALTLLTLLAGRLSAWPEAWLLTGATVHTVSGETLAPGQVLIRDGKILAVGTHLVPADARTIDLKGQHLYPGLIALNTVLGLTEISGLRQTQDSAEVGEYTPDVQSWIAVNPDSELIPVARANGIALFEPVPKGSAVAGQSGIMTTTGWTSEEMTVHQPAALHVFWPKLDLTILQREGARGKTKAKPLEEQALADFFDEAKAYARGKAAASDGNAPAPIPAWEAMLPFVKGEHPIVVHADDVRQIRAAVAWAGTNGYRMILAGGREAARVADLLAATKIPVIYEHAQTQPVRDTDPYDRPFATPALLTQAGVKVVFSIGSDAFNAGLIKNLPYAAAQAVAYGLAPEVALKAITLYPAELAGVADRFGSIEPGKNATLVATTGDILDIRSNVTRMWIHGREVSLDTRHTRFYERYQNRPKPL